MRAGGTVRQAPVELAGRSMLDVLEDWDALAPTLRALDPAQLTAVDHAVLLAPLQYPRKVLGAGANYYAHLAEMGVARPAGPVVPYFFFKPPTGPVTPSSFPLGPAG